MAIATDSKVNVWRGKRATYDLIEKKDYWTHYYVKEPTGIWSEYFGTIPIRQTTGQLFPVDTVVESLPSNLKSGQRFLVGRDKSEINDAEYYIVEIVEPISETIIIPLGDMSVRIKDRHLYSYQLVDGKLTTYDNGIFCGVF